MPDRLLSVGDALFTITRQVNLLGAEANQDDISAVMTPAQEPLETLASVRTLMQGKEWSPDRQRMAALAQAAIILHRQRSGILPRNTPLNRDKKPSVFTAEGVLAFCEDVITDCEKWFTEAAGLLSRLNGVTSRLSALRQALAYLRRRNEDYAVTYYINEHMDALRLHEDRTTKSLVAARALIVKEREETLALLTDLRDALSGMKASPKDRAARASVLAAATALLNEVREEQG